MEIDTTNKHKKGLGIIETAGYHHNSNKNIIYSKLNKQCGK